MVLDGSHSLLPQRPYFFLIGRGSLAKEGPLTRP
jgi:hypothetical protein